MKIIEPSFEILNQPSYQDMLRHIELSGRTCYKSEERITDDSAAGFIKRLIKMNHGSVLEHSSISVRFICDRGVSHELVRHRICSFSQESTRYCVAGESKLTAKNPHNSLTVADLYKLKINSKNGSWKRINIRRVNENTGGIEYSTVKDIFDVGQKETVVVKTRLGYSVTVTPDHKIKSDNGYIEAKDLCGRKIAVNGTYELYTNKDWLKNQYNALMKTAPEIASEFGFNVNTVKKWILKHQLPVKPRSYFNKGRAPWNKGLSEKDDSRVKNQANALRDNHWNNGNSHNTLCRADRIKKLSAMTYHKTVKEYCELCGIKTSLYVHHIDGDRTNNARDNLITVCARCHLGVHHKTNQAVYYDEVVSVEPGPFVQVYDIVMPDPHNNFIADGICVHNCNYSGEKFGNELTFIRPCFWKDQSQPYWVWHSAMLDAEDSYLTLFKEGATPQEARSVLPNSLKTDIVVTANLRQWRLVFNQRCAPAAHPQMRQSMLPVLGRFINDYPAFFEDMDDLYQKGCNEFARNGWNLAEVAGGRV